LWLRAFLLTAPRRGGGMFGEDVTSHAVIVGLEPAIHVRC
jgi:hypothetical protein